MTRKRIVYLIKSLTAGGAHLPIPRIAAAMAENGYDIIVLALSPGDRSMVALFDMAGIKWQASHHSPYDPRTLSWLRDHLDRLDPQLLWTSSVPPAVIGQIIGPARGLPVVSWKHSAFLKPASRFLLKRLRARCDLWITDSHAVADFVATQLGVDDVRLHILPLFSADADAPRAVPWQAGEVFRIASLGRLDRAKGYDILVDAVNRIARERRDYWPAYHITIAGDGPERAMLEQQMSDAARRILTFAGHCDAPASFLAGQHAYIQPSRFEGLGIAAHEAMAAGLAPVASDVGEMARTIAGPGGDDNGWLVPPGDAGALADALGALLDHPEHAALLGAGVRQRVMAKFAPEEFDRSIATLAKHFDRLTG